MLVAGGFFSRDQWCFDTGLPNKYMEQAGYRHADKAWARALDVTPPAPDLSQIRLVRNAKGHLELVGHVGNDVESVGLRAADTESARGGSAFGGSRRSYWKNVDYQGDYSVEGKATDLPNGTKLTLCFADGNGKGSRADFVVDDSVPNGIRPLGGLFTVSMDGNDYIKTPFQR